MSWFIIVALLLVGWLLLFVEIFFIPGVTVVALIGSGLMAAGIYFSFSHYGSTAGWLTLAGALVAVLLSFWYGFKSGFWNKLGLKDTLAEGKMNVIDETKIKVGDTGKAQSKIAPIGTGYFNGNEFEVNSMGEYIEPNTTIEVIKIANNKIFIKPKT